MHTRDQLLHLVPELTTLPADVAVPDGDVLLMTEKDAVKCAPFAPAESWVWPVRAQLAPEAAELIVEKLDGPPTA